ncbi:MAG: hypothetical protein QOG92_1487, partial [Verrucomicrobiota bacterium]|nr:hypothetical protein [Verrucomicrobiota bacterium]
GTFSGRYLGAFFYLPNGIILLLTRMNQELQDFISDGARRITPVHLDKLVRLLPNIRLAVTQVTDFPDLSDQVEFLAEILEDFHAGLNRSIPFMAIAESAFALFYLQKATDIIPDSIPRKGFADDAAIVTAVFENYKRPFLKHVLARNARRTIEHDPDSGTEG